MAHIWVVEWFNGKKWVGMEVRFRKNDAIDDMRCHRRSFPKSKYRVKKYIREGE